MDIGQWEWYKVEIPTKQDFQATYPDPGIKRLPSPVTFTSAVSKSIFSTGVRGVNNAKQGSAATHHRQQEARVLLYSLDSYLGPPQIHDKFISAKMRARLEHV